MKTPRFIGLLIVLVSIAGFFLLNWFVEDAQKSQPQATGVSADFSGAMWMLLPFGAGLLQLITGVHLSKLASDWDKLPLAKRKQAEIGIFVVFLLVLGAYGAWLTIKHN